MLKTKINIKTYINKQVHSKDFFLIKKKAKHQKLRLIKVNTAKYSVQLASQKQL